MGDSGLRQRKKKSRQFQDRSGGGDRRNEAKNKGESRMESDSDDHLPRVISVTGAVVGVIIMVYMGRLYSDYCNTLHENQMYFTNIKEVEREISFRTESGLYYSYYKQLVHSSSFSQGMYELMNDNRTEYLTTMNVLARMNIYQEVFLGVIYRASLGLQKSFQPIYFYLYSIYNLQGLLLCAVFVLAWSLARSPLAGVFAAALYVYNKEDTSRSAFSSPLRENFSLPFLWCQLAAISFYFAPGKQTLIKKLSIPVIFFSTFVFALTWQFNQFILLLQSMSLFGVQVLQLVPHRKILTVYAAQLVALLLVCLLQFLNPMILTGPLFCFVPAAIVVMKIQGERASGSPVVVRALNVLWYIVLVFAVAAGFAFVAKMLCEQDSDAHIFRFVMVKFGLAKSSRDFDVMLYLCNGAFGFLEESVIERLASKLVLPLYVPFHLGLLVAMAVALIQKWSAERSLSLSQENKQLTEEDQQPHLLSSRPELAYHCIQAVAFGMIAITVTRMKFLWTPYMCVMAAVCIGDFAIWRYLLEKLRSSNVNMVILLQNLMLVGFLGLLWHMFLPKYKEEMDTLREFHDPDTVALMEWIKKSTPATAVFAGSMQLLAGVKLCTNRAITNHPHYEDTQLRYRTKDILQMYGRKEPSVMHEILTRYGATHIILEDSICLARKDDGCGTPSIMDMVNRELPDSGPAEEGLVRSSTPRFCNEIRYGKGAYAKYFRSVFKNRTFRIYQLL